MNNLPEKVYIEKYYETEKRSTMPATIEQRKDDDIEYVRKDAAESETIATIIAFADWYDKNLNPQEFQNEKWMNESNAKSFLTSRNK